MSEVDIIRAWNDEEYRSSLSDEQRAKLPPNPAGEVELTDEELAQIQGGMNPVPPITTLTGIVSVVGPCPVAE